ncbi:MAG: DUF441 domain-containing protein [Arsenophonus sp.]|nr:MAG: DUF441 domain-containing protein [Arsenophonus sp.]
MSNFNTILVILFILIILGIISHNIIVTIATLLLLIVRITPLNIFFPWIEKNVMTVGILILTIGIITPIASGRLAAEDMISSFLHWESLLAIIIGILVSWLGSRGISLIYHKPSMITGLLFGTLIGVSVFRGVAVGPLIAAGILSLLINHS